MTTPHSLLVLSSGGDAPGMNAAIRAVVRTAHQQGMSVQGVHGGYDGLIDNALFPLQPAAVANCLQRGGTLLKTTRSKRFFDQATREQVRQHLKQKNIDSVIVLGGNGSLAGAAALHRDDGPAIIGIPCTIDNDIIGTDYCIGFDTACNTALKAIDNIRDTALSLERRFIIEVMGRTSGFIAEAVGVAGGAEVVLTPEFPLSVDEIIAQLNRTPRQKLTSIIVAAESSQPGWTVSLANELSERTDQPYKTCVLGHIQRGGSPTLHDRLIATRMGHAAVSALCDGHKAGMIASHQGNLSIQPFPKGDEPRQLTDQALLAINACVSGC